MIKIIEKWKIWFLISALMILPGIFALSSWGLNFGIDFAGGTLVEIEFNEKDKIETDEIRQVFESKEIKNPQISLTSPNAFLSRTHVIEAEKYQDLRDELETQFGSLTELRVETVGPTISRDLTVKAIQALALAILMIIIYIAWAFRSVPKPLSSWKFGASAIVALVHDVLIVIGVFAILGRYLNVEIDNLFITALLTVIGFSVHDTIVVFDRIRENLKTTSGDMAYITNKSIFETLSRSINTTSTVLFVLLALLLFGGQTIFWFVLALFIGILVGTYSSIFIATVIVVLWHKKAKV